MQIRTLAVATFAFLNFSALLTPVLHADESKLGNACPEWPEIKKVIANLKKVDSCSSTYTTLECRENLGLLGVGAVFGAAAGAKAALRAPSGPTCGLRGADSRKLFYFLPKAYAAPSCRNPIQEMLGRLADELESSVKIREAELGNALTEKAIKDNPELKRAADEWRSTAEERRKLGSGARAQWEQNFMAKYRIEARDLKTIPGFLSDLDHTCLNDRCRKMVAIFWASEAEERLAKTALNSYRIPIDKADDVHSEVYRALQKEEALVKSIREGKLTTISQLEQAYFDANKSLHPAVHGRFANLIEKVQVDFPSLKSLKDPAILRKNFSDFAKGPRGLSLKKILPAGLGALVSAGAFAADCSKATDGCKAAREDVLEGFLPYMTQTGCSEIYSTFSTPQTDCKDAPEWTARIKTFLQVPETTQMKEVCRSPRFQMALRGLEQKSFPKKSQVSCSAESLTIRDHSVNGIRIAKFDKSGALTSISSRSSAGGSKDYELQFTPDGTIGSGKVIEGRTFKPITSKSFAEPISDEITEVIDGFAGQQVFLNYAIDCCRGGDSGVACDRRASGSSGVSPTSSPATN